MLSTIRSAMKRVKRAESLNLSHHHHSIIQAEFVLNIALAP